MDLFPQNDAARPGLRLAESLGEPDGMQVETRWLLDTLTRKGVAQGYQISLRAADGTRYILEGSARRLRQHVPPRFVLVWHDITQRESETQAQRELLLSLQEQYSRQTQELAQKVEDLARANRDLQELDSLRAELTSLVSHQIRAPLTNMMGAIEQMQATCPAMTSTCQRMFRVLQQQSERLNRLVRDVLNLTQLEAGALSLQVEPVSLMPVLEQAAEHFSARSRQVVLPYAPVLPMVMADRDRLLEILLNLLDNADRFSPPDLPIQIQVRPTETEVVVTVLDRGPGLPPEDLERVFQKFYRGERGDAQAGYGYGLGLYICRRLLEAMQGRIWAANRPGGGAAFHFTLPVSP
jgi:two-component system sensor histidine kinase KdpD